MYIALFITAVVVIGFTILFVRAKHDRQKQQDTVEDNEEKQHAISNGLTEQFVNNIQKQYDHLRPHGEAFDAEKAVAIYSTEDEKRWAKEAAKYRNEND